jgi:hypothetical protein
LLIDLLQQLDKPFLRDLCTWRETGAISVADTTYAGMQVIEMLRQEPAGEDKHQYLSKNQV